MSNPSMHENGPDMPEVDFNRANRIVRSRKGRERLPLAAVRNAVGKTRVEVAEATGVPEAEISRVESGEALLLSSLTRYAQALGGEIEVAIVIDGRRYLINCGGFAGPV
jgi:hypothetical protein